VGVKTNRPLGSLFIKVLPAGGSFLGCFESKKTSPLFGEVSRELIVGWYVTNLDK